MGFHSQITEDFNDFSSHFQKQNLLSRILGFSIRKHIHKSQLRRDSAGFRMAGDHPTQQFTVKPRADHPEAVPLFWEVLR